jgi:hypothetical protein
LLAIALFLLSVSQSLGITIGGALVLFLSVGGLAVTVYLKCATTSTGASTVENV